MRTGGGTSTRRQSFLSGTGTSTVLRRSCFGLTLHERLCRLSTTAGCGSPVAYGPCLRGAQMPDDAKDEEEKRKAHEREEDLRQRLEIGDIVEHGGGYFVGAAVAAEVMGVFSSVDEKSN